MSVSAKRWRPLPNDRQKPCCFRVLFLVSHWPTLPLAMRHVNKTSRNSLQPLINPRRMRCRVTVAFCLLSLNLLHTSFMCRKWGVVGFFFYVVFKVCVVWLSLKTLRSKVLASFADRHCLPCFLTRSRWTEETAMASFQREECVLLAIAPTTQPTHQWS